MPKYLLLFLLSSSCLQKPNLIQTNIGIQDTTIFAMYSDPLKPMMYQDSTLPQKIVAFAKTQIGVNYKYCSMTPSGGFDCSGFVNYVLNHFGINVPRASVDFTDIGEEIKLNLTQPGDLILFTGTNHHNRIVGHIGIITANENGEISFIQSSSGAAYGVIISSLDKSYMARLVKVIRIVK